MNKTEQELNRTVRNWKGYEAQATRARSELFEKIRVAHSFGMTVTDIAKMTGYSRQAVYNILP